MPSAFRVAFVGVDHPHGAGWREVLMNLKDEVEITAIVPCFGGTLYSLEERLAGIPRFPTVDELVNRGGNLFDGALVALPNSESPGAAVMLANSGKHLLLEKPGTGSPDDARPIAEAVHQNGVAFQCGYLWRYDEGAWRLRQMVGDGRFGHLICAELSFVTSDVARRGAHHYLFDPAVSQRGFFNWLACHWLDLLLYITGDSVCAVTARVGRFGATAVDVEDGGAVILELSGGSLATFVGGYWLPRWTGEAHWTFRGSERWVHWDPMRQGTGGVLTTHGPQPQFQAMNEVYAIPPDTTPGYGGNRAVALIRDWVASAREKHQCRNTPESMLATLDLLDVIYRSSLEGRRVECRIGSETRA